MSSRTRSVGEQVKSGFLIAGGMIGGLLTFVMAALGIASCIPPPPSPPGPLVGPLIGSVEIVLASAIMFAAAGRWPRYAVGLIFGWGALRALGYAIFPTDAKLRGAAIAFAAYCILASALLYRFNAPSKSAPTILDRVALTALGLSCASVLSLNSPRAAALVLAAGLLPLVMAWAVQYNQKPAHGPIHRRAAL